MADPQLDPGGFFEFDLARGAVRARDGSRVVIVADDMLASLMGAAVKHGDLTAVRRLGMQLGVEARRSLGTEPADCAPELALSHAAGVAALFGWGQLALERWGDALVVTVQDPPALDAQELGVATLLGGLFSSLVGREIACVPIGGSGKFLAVHPSTAERVWDMAQRGADVPTIVSRLAQGGKA